MNNIYDAFFLGNNPADILKKQKLADELDVKNDTGCCQKIYQPE